MGELLASGDPMSPCGRSTTPCATSDVPDARLLHGHASGLPSDLVRRESGSGRRPNHPFLTYAGWRALVDLQVRVGDRLEVPRHVPSRTSSSIRSETTRSGSVPCWCLRGPGLGVRPKASPRLPARLRRRARGVATTAAGLRVVPQAADRGVPSESVGRRRPDHRQRGRIRRPHRPPEREVTTAPRRHRDVALAVRHLGRGLTASTGVGTAHHQWWTTTPVPSGGGRSWDRCRGKRNPASHRRSRRERASAGVRGAGGDEADGDEAGWPLSRADIADELVEEDAFDLERAAELLASLDLDLEASNDVLWDAVVSVEPDGVDEVFDATVIGGHNFIANGIAVHNSIEQDADMVILLHREEAYERESPRGGEADRDRGQAPQRGPRTRSCWRSRATTAGSLNMAPSF